MLYGNLHRAARAGKPGAGLFANPFLSFPSPGKGENVRASHAPPGGSRPLGLYFTRLSKSPGPLLALAGSCLVLALLFLAFPTQALARVVTAGPSFQVNAGFETRYRDGNWVPVQVALHNDGPDFSGKLSLSAAPPQFLQQNNSGTPSNYQAPISLANGAQKQVTLYVPLYYDEQGIVVKLLNSNGDVVGSQVATLNPLMPGDVLVGILSDQTSGFGPLSGTTLPSQGSSVVIEFLNASTMPTMTAILKNFDAIVLDNFTTGNLSPAQLAALQTWVKRGGTLILVGGPEWHRTMSALPAGLVPVMVQGTATIPPGTPLLSAGGPRASSFGQNNVPDTVQSPVTISTATTMAQADPSKSEVVLASGTAPLIVQARQGQGAIIYLAFDPTLEPILGWQGAGVLWKGLLLRSMGEQLLTHAGTNISQPEQPLLAYRMSTLLQSLLAITIPSPWWTLAILLTGYILVLGPVRLLLVKRLKRRDWSWRIVLSSIVIFSLLSYGLAFKEKGASILGNSITIAQLGQNGSPASLTTYLGVFVPNEGDFQVHIPGNGLVQPSPDNLSTFQGAPAGPTQETPATIAPVQGGTEVNLQGVNIWTLHAILSEQDRQMHKGLVSQLTLQNGALTGTVTNMLGYALSDSFLLMSGQVFNLGHLAAGETKQVQLKLNNAPLPPNSTLADLIALNTGSSAYDSLFASRPQNAWQRHLAVLYALDGEGFYGYLPACVGQCNPPASILPALPGINPPASNNTTLNPGVSSIIATPGWPYTATREIDPLLVPGSPATFLGWAENPLDSAGNVTVNDIDPTGLHETLIQAPLNVNLAGSLNFPPNFIPGHLIDAEGDNTQMKFPGVYTISTGSMTFEYTVPHSANLRIDGLTITEPPDISVFAQVGTILAADSLPFRLYNWRTNAWDAISLNQNTFTTNNVSAYIGPGGRVLLQLANKDSSLGTFAFGKPLLNLQGVVLDSSSANR